MADTIVFTSPYSPIDFFNQYNLDSKESFKQFQRRITATIQITDKQLIQLQPQTKPTLTLTQEELLNAIAINQTYSITYSKIAFSKKVDCKINPNAVLFNFTIYHILTIHLTALKSIQHLKNKKLALKSQG